jgi:hypothetical protein
VIKYKVCIKTPAGEKHSVAVEGSGQPHAVHAPLRQGVSQAMKWLDDHVEWRQGASQYPKITTPIDGPENFEIVMHDANTNCGLCG